jgi:hypothetical protein
MNLDGKGWRLRDQEIILQHGILLAGITED